MSADNFVLCQCVNDTGYNFAQIKFNKRTKAAFAACEHYFAYKTLKCEFYLSLTDTQIIAELNTIQGNIMLISILIFTAKMVTTQSTYLEFGSLNIDDVRNCSSSTTSVLKRKISDPLTKDHKKAKI